MSFRSEPPSMRDIEDWFRFMAFKIAYRETYADIKNNDERFGKALVSSMDLIADKALMVQFYNQHHPSQEPIECLPSDD